MPVIQKTFALYAMTVALAVGLNYMATPLYDDGSTGYPVWQVLDWFMAVAVLGTFLANLAGKRHADPQDLPAWLAANTLFYASLVTLLWFYANWFGTFSGLHEPMLWDLHDPLFVATVGTTGWRLWQVGN